MSIVADVAELVLGADTHRDTHEIELMSPTGRVLATARIVPIPASSGRATRHRLNQGGDRALNRALHFIALTRMRCCERTRAYVARRRAEGKSYREIRRCLKRYIAREIYRALSRPRTLDLSRPQGSLTPC